MQWCRLYKEFSNDPKVQALPFDMQRHLVMLFCLHIDNEIDDLTDDQISVFLRIDLKTFLKIKKIFQKNNFLDEHGKLVNWNKRQFVSDDSNARVARFRAKNNKQKEAQCNRDVTLHDRYSNVTVTPPESDTETDLDNLSIPPTPQEVKLGTPLQAMNDGRLDKFPMDELYPPDDLNALMAPLADHFPDMFAWGRNPKVRLMLESWVGQGTIVADIKKAIQEHGAVARSPLYFEHAVLKHTYARYNLDYKHPGRLKYR